MKELRKPTGLSVYQFVGLRPGPKLIILGAVHGNETCGTKALKRLQQEIESGEVCIEQGALTMVPITNPLAFQLERRHGDRNLNRNMRVSDNPQDFEDFICNVLCPMLEQHDVLLDLHSFQAPGIPFALIGASNNTGALEPIALAQQEEAMALCLGTDRFVEGWLETYAQGVRDRRARGVESHVDYGIGTTETMRRKGGIAVTLECGQHSDDGAPLTAYKAIRNTLAHLGMTSDAKPIPVKQPEVIRLYRVFDRLNAGDSFNRDWLSFEAIERGAVIAHRQDGSVLTADQDGWIVFPNTKAQVNQEWFYLAKYSDRLK
ncbi:MAG: succinylglutamate desuccinylase/aspartoacylase family protein [Proteobacteria bacterium]|nr:succinylglutamate desuccinylase/aspartoacylase family protein [Pseudomonadota bacterium]MDA1332482.1 succinylglutamate desuccinylase/aspartoacylase family protein [Pseudomonadota bacterium]